MINVYWAPWQGSNETYNDRRLSYKQPTWLLEDMESLINHENVVDNFFKCPGVLNHLKNTLVLRNSSDIHVEFRNQHHVAPLNKEIGRAHV